MQRHSLLQIEIGELLQLFIFIKTALFILNELNIKVKTNLDNLGNYFITLFTDISYSHSFKNNKSLYIYFFPFPKRRIRERSCSEYLTAGDQNWAIDCKTLAFSKCVLMLFH